MSAKDVLTAALLAGLLALSRCAADLSSSVMLQGASVYLPTQQTAQITESFQEVIVQGARFVDALTPLGTQNSGRQHERG